MGAKDRRIAELEWDLKCLRASYGQAVDPRVAALEAERDRLREVILRATAFVEETRAALAGEEKPTSIRAMMDGEKP
jgi:hypothetical protein